MEEYQKAYENFSPLKFSLNNDYINKIQQDQPVNIAFDDIALNNLIKKINFYRSMMYNKYDQLYQKSGLIQNLYNNTLKLFLISFIILYLIAPKFEFLRVDDETEESNEYKPNMLRITIITIILTLFYLFIFGIDILSQLGKILLE